MNPRQALQLAEQHQARLRWAVVPRRRLGVASWPSRTEARLAASRAREAVGWQLVEVGLQLAVSREAGASRGAPAGESMRSPGTAG